MGGTCGSPALGFQDAAAAAGRAGIRSHGGGGALAVVQTGGFASIGVVDCGTDCPPDADSERRVGTGGSLIPVLWIEWLCRGRLWMLPLP